MYTIYKYYQKMEYKMYFTVILNEMLISIRKLNRLNRFKYMYLLFQQISMQSMI